jgi:hypothetical protein
MNPMLGKLFTTQRGTTLINTAAAVLGIYLVIVIDSPRVGTILFLIVTCVESGVFSLIYGLRSAWWRVPAARAIFWVVLAYFFMSAQLIHMYLTPRRWWWSDDLRELLYMAFAIAGLNLVLTLTRVLGRAVYTRP